MWQTCGRPLANVAELAYATVLKTVPRQGVVGSTPTVRTNPKGLKIPVDSRACVGELRNWLVSGQFSGSLFFCAKTSTSGSYVGMWQNLWQELDTRRMYAQEQ